MASDDAAIAELASEGLPLAEGMRTRIFQVLEKVPSGVDARIESNIAFVKSVYETDVSPHHLMFAVPLAVSPHPPARIAAYFVKGSLFEVKRALAASPGPEDDPEKRVAFSRDLVRLVIDQVRDLYERSASLRFSTNARRLLVDFLEAAELKERMASLRELEERAAAAVERAEQSATHTEEVAGSEARAELSKHFQSYANWQRGAAETLRLLVVALVTGVAILWFITIGTSPPISWIELVRKIALGLPIAALAAYLAREASRHFGNAHWARTITILLRTVNAYTDALSDGLRESIRGELGKQIFSPQAEAHGKSVLADGKTIAELAGELVRAIERRTN